jgi:enolase
VIDAVPIGSGILREETARQFRSLNDISIATNMKVIKESDSCRGRHEKYNNSRNIFSIVLVGRVSLYIK